MIDTAQPGYTPQFVLLSASGRNFDGFDMDGFADHLGLVPQPLVTGDAELSDLLAENLLAGNPKLFIGTGNIDFDARAAAALGIPLLLLIDREDMAAELARRECTEIGAVVAHTFTADEAVQAATLDALKEDLAVEVEPVMSAELFESWLLEKAKSVHSHIVLPEGDDDRILIAADKILAQDICELTILGEPDAVTKQAEELGLDLSRAHIHDPLTDPHREEFATEFARLRAAKGVTIEQARETMQDISYYATMMVQLGLADGMVSGAAHTTAHTIKPSFQIIKTKPGTSTVSSIFLMIMRGHLWAFGDCAVNPNPTPQQLAEIATESAHTAAQFGIEPRVAMLSYSTGSSGTGPDVERVTEAVSLAHELDPAAILDGPLQFDAAVDETVASKKMPESPVAGQANVFIFPDLDAGNIGYKTAQRTGHALAVGPILQGLNKPVNDLSRGATVADIVNTVAVTVIQAGKE